MNRSGEENRRVRSTRRQLKEGLLHLMKDKPINEITAKELTEYVDINRGTFYLHYSDTYDLLHSIEDDMLTQCDRILSNKCPGDVEDTVRYLTEIIAFIEDNMNVFKVLFGPNNKDMHFTERVRNLVMNRCSAFWSAVAPDASPDTTELYNSFVVMGFVGVLKTWVNHGQRESPEDISRLISGIIHSSAKDYMRMNM